MSVECHLAGLFQPNDNQTWHPDLAWQPIPVHTIAKEQGQFEYVSCEIKNILKIFLSFKICCWYWNRSALVMTSSSPSSTLHQTFANAWTVTRKCWIIWLSRVAWICQRLMTLNTFTTRSLSKYIPFQNRIIDELGSLMNLFCRIVSTRRCPNGLQSTFPVQWRNFRTQVSRWKLTIWKCSVFVEVS